MEASLQEKQSVMDGLEARLRDKDVEYSQLEERLHQIETDLNAGREQHQALHDEVSSLTHDKQVSFLLLSYVNVPVYISIYKQRTQLPALATGLAQGPVRDGGTGTHWLFLTGSSLPSPYQAPGLGHLPTLPQRRRDGRASGVPVSAPRSRQEGHLARRHLHNRSATPLELPGTDWRGARPPDRE